MKKFALIVAGGSGNRMENSVPKQFIELGGKPILIHTFQIFNKYDPDIEFILVLPKKQIQYWKELCARFNFKFNYKMALGGESRFFSVKNGLDLIEEQGIVFIHDAVRPFVSVETIANCFSVAQKKGNALPVIPVAESVRIFENGESRAVDRSKYFLVQTPQTFKTDVIKAAYQQQYSELFTDDASVLEKTGEKINLVEGNRENIKITYPQDLVIARAFLVNSSK